MDRTSLLNSEKEVLTIYLSSDLQQSLKASIFYMPAPQVVMWLWNYAQ